MAAGLIAGAGFAKAESKGATVVFLSAPDLCSYCAAVNITAREKAKELGINLEIIINNFDAAEQAAQVDQALAKNPDGIIIWPVDANALVPSFRKIGKAGIPLLVTTSSVNNKFADNWFSWHGPDDISMSAIAAKDMVASDGGKGSWRYW